MDRCGVCEGNDACVDCNDVPNGGDVIDECGICGGDGSTCATSAPESTSSPGSDNINILKYIFYCVRQITTM